MRGPVLVKKLILVAICSSWVAYVSAQQVHVYDADPPAKGTTPTNNVLKHSGRNQKLLVIPVVSSDSPFDPMNNTLASKSPTMFATLTDRFNQVSQFWDENSFGAVSLDTTVLDRYFQMPRGNNFYFNPSYLEPNLVGTEIFAEPVAVPAGRIKVIVHISSSDETTVNLDFLAGDSPYTFAALQTRIQAQITPVVGDKLSFQIEPSGGSRRLHFSVPTIYASAGTFVHLDYAGSNEAILDALGLSRPSENLAGVSVLTRDAKFPLTTTAGDTFTITIHGQGGATQSPTWTMTNATFATAAAFVAVHGTTNPGFTITAGAGNQLNIQIAPTIAQPITQIDYTSTNARLLDNIGLSKSVEQDGVIDAPSTDTLKGNWNLIAGQALAAFLMNGLTRPHAISPLDPFPNLAITAGNKAAIDTAMSNFLDPFGAVAVIFMDAPNKRGGAQGGYLNIGIDNVGFLYEFQTFKWMHISYDFDSPSVPTHELGHNFGLWDLYNNSDGSYDPNLKYPNNWDIMSSDGPRSHTCLWHKEIIEQWLTQKGANIDVFPSPPNTGDIQTRRYVLTPLEYSPANYDGNLGAVPPGRTVAKSIRLPLGLGQSANDHFLVIENRQVGQLFSQNLPQAVGAPTRGGMYIHDDISPSSFDFFAPTTRNVVHPLTDKPLLPGGDVSPILDAAPNPDVNLLQTYPAYDGLTVDIVGSLAGPAPFAGTPSLLVDVTRQQKDFLDLGITPWGAPPWESPDIWIEHGDQNPLSAVPLPGNGQPARWSPAYDMAANGGVPLNWIRVQVTNSGTVDATAVQVRVKINTPPGMGDAGTWVALPLSSPQDIPAHQSRIFNLSWNPTGPGHTCILAEVFRWNSTLGDSNPWNNRTQENVDDFYPTASSPWGVTPFQFEVANGRNKPINVLIAPEDLPPGLVVGIDQDFVTIPAKTKVLINAKLSIDDQVIPIPTASTLREQRKRFRVFHLSAYLMNREYRLPIGGVTYRVFPTIVVTVGSEVKTDPSGNIVVTGTTQPPAPGEAIEIHLTYPSGKQKFVVVTIDPSGGFSATIPPEEPGNVHISVNYPPGQTFAPTSNGETVFNPKHPGGGPGPAFHRDVSFFLGPFIASNTLELESGPETGFRFAYNFHKPLTAEFETGMAFSRDASSHVLLVHNQGQLLFHFGNISSPVRPFLLGGAGIESARKLGSSSNSFRGTLGGGLKFQWKPKIGFRADFRSVLLNDLLNHGFTANAEIQWGVYFSF